MKIVVIGTGFGENVVAPAFQSLGCEVQVVSPRDDAAVKNACSENVDLMSVHSPPFMHRDHVLLALDHGSAVLCDKPFGVSVADAQAMCNAVEGREVSHFLNFEFRCRSANRKVKELVDSGVIGTLQHGSWLAHNHLLRERHYGWLFDASLGGGWLGAYGSHLIDHILWLADSDMMHCSGIRSISQNRRRDRDGQLQTCTAEDAASFHLVLANGFSATVDISASAPAFLEPHMTLIGSEGTIELFNDERLVLKTLDKEPETFSITSEQNQFMGAQTAWLKEVVSAVKTQSKLTPNFYDGLATRKVLDQLNATLYNR